jgi:hypothetical protein
MLTAWCALSGAILAAELPPTNGATPPGSDSGAITELAAITLDTTTLDRTSLNGIGTGSQGSFDRGTFDRGPFERGIFNPGSAAPAARALPASAPAAPKPPAASRVRAAAPAMIPLIAVRLAAALQSGMVWTAVFIPWIWCLLTWQVRPLPRKRIRRARNNVRLYRIFGPR